MLIYTLPVKKEKRKKREEKLVLIGMIFVNKFVKLIIPVDPKPLLAHNDCGAQNSVCIELIYY